MSHTSEQARELWCPMARISQAGHTDIQGSYNRTITKLAVPVRLAKMQDPEDFELGQEPSKEQTKFVLETVVGVSTAAYCIADKCAMWRQESAQSEPTGRGYCGLAGRPGL